MNTIILALGIIGQTIYLHTYQIYTDLYIQIGGHYFYSQLFKPFIGNIRVTKYESILLNLDQIKTFLTGSNACVNISRSQSVLLNSGLETM